MLNNLPSNLIALHVETSLWHEANASLGLFRLIKVKVMHIGSFTGDFIVTNQAVSLDSRQKKKK